MPRLKLHIIVLKRKSKKLGAGVSWSFFYVVRVEVPSPKIIIKLFGHVGRFTVKENHIGPAVGEILCYTQKDILLLDFWGGGRLLLLHVGEINR